ncbi:uncharacterized protein METZ01_LOCUS102223, partial [marine metagenome]
VLHTRWVAGEFGTGQVGSHGPVAVAESSGQLPDDWDPAEQGRGGLVCQVAVAAPGHGVGHKSLKSDKVEGVDGSGGDDQHRPVAVT